MSIVEHNPQKKPFPLSRSAKVDYRGQLIEYDLISAGYNIFVNDLVPIYDTKIEPERIEAVIKAKGNKLLRNKLIGLIQRDYPETKKMFTVFFRHYMEQFLIANNLDLEKDVLRVSKDSLIVKKICNNLVFSDYIVFRELGLFSELILFKDSAGKVCEVYIPVNEDETVAIKGALMYTEKWKGFFKFFKLVADSYKIGNLAERFARISFLIKMYERDSIRYIEETDRVDVLLDGGKIILTLAMKDVPAEYISSVDTETFKTRFLIPLADTLIRGTKI